MEIGPSKPNEETLLSCTGKRSERCVYVFIFACFERFQNVFLGAFWSVLIMRGGDVFLPFPVRVCSVCSRIRGPREHPSNPKAVSGGPQSCALVAEIRLDAFKNAWQLYFLLTNGILFERCINLLVPI